MAETIEIRVPDIGDFDGVDVTEVLVAKGDKVEVEQGLIVLESDKASMEVPSPEAGTIVEVLVEAGATVKEGDLVARLEVAGEGKGEGGRGKGESGEATEDAGKAGGKPEGERDGKDERGASRSAGAAEETEGREDARKADPPSRPEKEPEGPTQSGPGRPAGATETQSGPGRPAGATDQPPPPRDEAAQLKVHASPSVRRFARTLGADLTRISGSGPKSRILREDVEAFVKSALSRPAGAAAGTVGGGLPTQPEVDFSKFGEVASEELTKIQKLTGQNLGRSWLLAPRVTQFDEADVTELEAFRKSLGPEAEKKGVKLTFLAFLMKATAYALAEFPRMNSSLAADGASLVVKKYIHLGIAVDTPKGLVVPVVRDVDRKGIYELASELTEISGRARDGKLTPKDLSGASFTITSLGGIGGTQFTPIVNVPEVGILGVSRSAMKPVWDGAQFVPRLILPLALSYDHRVIDGAYGVRFTTALAAMLTDLRRLLL